MVVWMQQRKIVYRTNKRAEACTTTVVMAAARFAFVAQTRKLRRLRAASTQARAHAKLNSALARTAPLLSATGRFVSRL